MKEIESQLLELFNTSPEALMELAGRALSCQLSSIGKAVRVGILAGKGNNGGDALTCARFLLDAGLNVKIYSLDRSGKMEYLSRYGAELCTDLDELSKCDIIVDGLFGYGLRLPLTDDLKTIIEKVNSYRKPIISVDLPSGLTAEGAVSEPIVRSRSTVSLGLPKLNQVTGLGLIYSGNLVLEQLGYKHYFNGIETNAYMVEENDLQSLFSKIRRDTYHKREAGQVTVAAGSDEFLGAALLVVKTLILMGTGLVYIEGDENLQKAVIHEFPQVIKGRGHGALVIGPGLKDLSLASLLIESEEPKVIDAGALIPQLLDVAKNAVITPHEGEAARLLNVDVREVRADRYRTAKMLYERYGHVVLLKGPGTIIYDGSCFYVVPFYEPKLSTGGTGDVLSGLIGFLLARGLDLTSASVGAALLHGMAAKDFSTGLDLNAFVKHTAELWWQSYDR
jgi:NAD(P)H-hydrate epimerase